MKTLVQIAVNRSLYLPLQSPTLPTTAGILLSFYPFHNSIESSNSSILQKLLLVHMSTSIRNIAVAGATGNTGPTVLETLASSGFNIVVLSRNPAAARTKLGGVYDIIEVDYNDLESLQSSLTGQDAVVVCGVSMYAILKTRLHLL